jgi:hypothetical protein
MNPSYCFLWGYLKDHVYHTKLYTIQELQAELEAVAEEIAGVVCDTVDNFMVCLQ